MSRVFAPLNHSIFRGIIIHPVTAILFKTTSIAFGGRELIFKGLASIVLVLTGNSARGSGGANP